MQGVKYIVKIGEVSKLLGLSVATIRYYIEIGLLVPERKNYHHHFTDKDVEELKLILSYKDMYFSLKEIHDILSVERVSYSNMPRETKKVVKLLSNKYNSLVSQRNSIDTAIDRLKKIILETKHISSNPTDISGIPLTFLKLLNCPVCECDFVIKGATIKNGEIISGELLCNCGNRLEIQDGILFVDPVSHIYDTTLFDISNTLLEEYDAKTITVLKQDEKQLLSNLLSEKEYHNKVILETNIKRWFFLLKNIEYFNEDNHFIIAERYPEVIRFYKSQIEKKGLNHKALFLVCKPDKYPIKKKSIDLWVDYIDSNEHNETEDSFLPELIKPYLNSNARVHGIVIIMPNQTYVNALREIHPNVSSKSIEYFNPGLFTKRLSSLGYHVLNAFKIRDVWETSRTSAIKVSGTPPYRLLYVAKNMDK